MHLAVFHDLPAGGAKRSTCELIRRLAARHHVRVYTLSCAEHDFADLRPYVVTHHVFPFHPARLCPSPFGRVNPAVRLVDVARLAVVSRRIVSRIEQDGAQVVFAQPCQFSQSPLLLHYARRLPSVYYCQEPPRVLYETMPARPYPTGAAWWRGLNRFDPLLHAYRATVQRLDRRNTRAAATVLVASNFMRQTVERLYQVPARVIPHGVDAERFRPSPITKEHLVLSVGSLTPYKGFDFIIEAVARISVHRPALTIVANSGMSGEAAYLEQLARHREVHLTMLTGIGDHQLVELYNAAKVTAYAPIREPFGLVALESMACATPVVAVREGGLEETIVHEHTGLLLERDPEQFADALQRLLNDDGLASRYGQAGREHVLRNWTWDRTVGPLEQQLAAWAAASCGGAQ